MSSKVKCAFCKNYIPKDEAIHIGIQNFCDMDHVSLYKDKTQLKASGDYKPPPPKPTDPKAHAETLRKDGLRCRVCASRHNLHVHHILYRSEISIKNGRDELWNLITLCNTHHDMVHSDKGVWQPILKEAARLREDEGKLVPIMTLKKRIERENKNDHPT